MWVIQTEAFEDIQAKEAVIQASMGSEVGVSLMNQMRDPLHKEHPGLVLEPLQP